jgi:NTP pyrophosphatase (non-canonical NTP hydrolase)
MDMNKYQEQAKVTWLLGLNDDKLKALSYLMAGLAGEVGELSSLFAKGLRDGISDEMEYNYKVEKELGDVLWFVAVIADEFNFTLDEVADTNIEKLKSRMNRNVLKGSGDDR